jgi:hypothetical protein
MVSIEILIDLERHGLPFASDRFQIRTLMGQDRSIFEGRVLAKIGSNELYRRGLSGQSQSRPNQWKLRKADLIGDAHAGNTDFEKGKIDLGIRISMGLDPESMDTGDHSVALLVTLRGIFDAEGWLGSDILTSDVIEGNPGRRIGKRGRRWKVGISGNPFSSTLKKWGGSENEAGEGEGHDQAPENG